MDYYIPDAFGQKQPEAETSTTEEMKSTQLPELPKKPIPSLKPGKKSTGGGGAGTDSSYPAGDMIAFCSLSAEKFNEYKEKDEEEIKKKIAANKAFADEFDKKVKEGYSGLDTPKKLDDYYRDYLKRVDEAIDENFKGSAKEKEEILKTLVKNTFKEEADQYYKDAVAARKAQQNLERTLDARNKEGKEAYAKEPVTKDELYALLQAIEDGTAKKVYGLERMRDCMNIAVNQVQDTRLTHIEYKLENNGSSFTEFLITLCLQFGLGVITKVVASGIGKLLGQKSVINELRALRTEYSRDLNAKKMHMVVNNIKQNFRDGDAMKNVLIDHYSESLPGKAAELFHQTVDNVGLNLRNIKSLSPPSENYAIDTDGPSAAVCREMHKSISGKIANLRANAGYFKNEVLRGIIEFDQIPESKRMTRDDLCFYNRIFLFDIPEDFDKELLAFEQTVELYIWLMYLTANGSVLPESIQEEIRQTENFGGADDEISLERIQKQVGEIMRGIGNELNKMDILSKLNKALKSKDAILIEYLAKRFQRNGVSIYDSSLRQRPVYKQEMQRDDMGVKSKVYTSQITGYQPYYDKRAQIDELTQLLYDLYISKHKVMDIMNEIAPPEYLKYRQILTSPEENKKKPE